MSAPSIDRPRWRVAWTMARHSLRPHYHANHYAAFVLGPDGHNIEAVCREPECPSRS
jgi:hypothetical protein